MNRWKIPEALEREVLARDTQCVYSGVAFIPASPSRKHRPSWEHIVNDQRIVTSDNIARCCISCNASKGAKLLSDWLESGYCKRPRHHKRDRGPCGETGPGIASYALGVVAGMEAGGGRQATWMGMRSAPPVCGSAARAACALG